MSQTVISMFLHIIVVKVWTFILMNFNWNVIPLLCLYVNISLDELFFELAQDYSREEEPPDPGEWVWDGFIVVSNFLLFRIVWCQEIYPWAGLCRPPTPQELHFLWVGVYRQSPIKWGYGHVLCDRTLWHTCSVLIKGLYEKIQTRTIAKKILDSFHKEHRNHPSAKYRSHTVISKFYL